MSKSVELTMSYLAEFIDCMG